MHILIFYLTADTELDVGTASFSVAGWFKHPNAVSTTDTLIARSNNAVNGIGYKIYMNSSGNICFGIDDDATTFPDDSACSTATYLDSWWHHVEGVKSGTASITLYVDGVQVAQDASLLATGSLSGTSPPFQVGIDGDGSSNPWDGFIDEVKVFDYAKTADQVKADHTSKGSVLGASAVFGPIDADHALHQGLVGYWKMDDGVGNACSAGVNKSCDSSGNNNHGTWTNGAASTSGKFGYATNYNGVNSFVSVPDQTYLRGDQNITIATWIKKTAMSANAIIANKRTSDTNKDWEIYVDTDGFLRFESEIPGVPYGLETPAGFIQAGQWHHVVAALDITNDRLRLYVDGVLQAEDTTFGNSSDSSNAIVSIGRRADLSFPWDGQIDDFRIYNRPLSSAEVARLYDWGPGPVGHWKFDERQGVSATDSGTLANHGALTNGTIWSPGKLGSGLKFDGTNDFVAYGNTGTVSFGSVAPGASGTNCSACSSINWSHTVSGSNRLLVVAVGIGDTDFTRTIGVTYNSVAMASVGKVATNNEDDGYIEMFYLKAPPTGTNTVQVTLTGGVVDELNGGSLTFTGVDQITGIRNVNTNAGSGTSVSLTVQSATGNMVVDAYASGCAGTVTSAQTKRWEVQNSCNTGGETSAQSTAAGASSVNMGYTIPSDLWAIIGMDIIAGRTTSIPDIRSVSFWAKPDSTTEEIILLTDTANIDIAAGVVRGNNITTPTIYVDGVQTTTFPDTNWHHVVVTTDSPITATNFTIGAVSNFYHGFLDDVRIYNYELTPKQIVSIMNADHPSVGSPVASAIGHWKFDEGYGTNTNNSGAAGSTINGALSGMASPATGTSGWTNNGKFGKALNFDGTNDYVDIGDSAAFDLSASGKYSWSGWVNPQDFTAFRPLWAQIETISPNDQFIIYTHTTADTTYGPVTAGISAEWCSPNSSNCLDTHSTNSVLALNTWAHVLVTYDGNQPQANRFTIYVNGVNVTDTSDVASIGTIDDINSAAGQINIGRDGDFGDFARGAIDDVKFYDYALSADEVKVEYNQGKAIVLGAGSTESTTSVSASSSASAIAGSGVNDASFGSLAWTNPGNVTISDDTRATRTLSGTTATNYISASTFGFAIPTDATITGTTVMIERLRNGGTLGQARDNVVRLVKAGSVIGANKALTGTNWPTAEAVASYGGLGDLWSTTWTPAEINASNFGVVLAAAGSAGTTDRVANVDSIQIEIAYTSPAGEITVSANSAARAYCPPGDTATCNPPVGHWTFDERRGTTANDITGNAHTGTLTNSPAWTTGKIGQGLSFDGGNRYVDTGSDFIGTGADSVSFWYYPQKENGTPYIIVNGKFDIQLESGPDYQLRFTSDESGTNARSANNATPFKQWTHVAITRNASGVANFYINGALSGTANQASGTPTAGTNVILGGDGGSGSIDGILDDVRLYNYVRTPAQVAWDYNHGKPVAHWKFDECTGTTAHDSSAPPAGGGYNGTINPTSSGNTTAGTCSSGVSTQMWNNGTNGKFNASLDFDGTDDYVQVADNSALRFDTSAEDFSLFAWVKRTTTGTEYIISKEDADNDGYRMQFNASNQVLCSQDATDLTSTAAIIDTNWHLIGCTIDRDGNGQVYIDAVANGATVSMGTDAMVTTSNIRIGTRSYTSTSYFNGLIDDVRIYNYLLTPTKIRTVYDEDAAVRFGPLTGSP